MASVSGIPRCVRIVGSMNRMPFEAHKNPNETIQTRTVVRAGPGANNSNTVTPVGTASSGFTLGAALISSGQGTANGSLLDLHNRPFCIRDAAFAEQIANRFRHVTANEKQE